MKLVNKFQKVIEYCEKEGNYKYVYDFIKKETSGIVSKKKQKELLDMIPMFLEHTYEENMAWIYRTNICRFDGFMDEFKEGLKNVNLYDRIDSYHAVFSQFDNEKFYDEEILLVLLSKDLYKNDIEKIFKDLCNTKNRLADYFLRCCSYLSYGVYKTLLITASYLNRSLIYRNVDLFIEKCSDDILLLYNYTEEDKEASLKVKKYINNNMERIIEESEVSSWSLLYQISDDNNKKIVIRHIENNFDKFINNYENIFVLKKNMGIIPEIEDRVNSYIDSNFRDILVSIYLDDEEVNNLLDDENKIRDRKLLIDFLYIVFEEVCRNENVSFSQISYVGGGSYSDVYGVGNKIIKLGKEREKFNFHNNPYIVAPLLRKRVPLGNALDEYIYIEVQERVQKVEKVSTEELYQLYKKIRNIGLVWLDIKASNVGRLLKDNDVYWNSELLPTDTALSLDEYRGNEKLKAGDLVVIDSDFIYDEDKVPTKFYSQEWSFAMKQLDFEMRYQKERQEENGKRKK